MTVLYRICNFFFFLQHFFYVSCIQTTVLQRNRKAINKLYKPAFLKKKWIWYFKSFKILEFSNTLNITVLNTFSPKIPKLGQILNYINNGSWIVIILRENVNIYFGKEKETLLCHVLFFLNHSLWLELSKVGRHFRGYKLMGTVHYHDWSHPVNCGGLAYLSDG